MASTPNHNDHKTNKTKIKRGNTNTNLLQKKSSASFRKSEHQLHVAYVANNLMYVMRFNLSDYCLLGLIRYMKNHSFYFFFVADIINAFVYMCMYIAVRFPLYLVPLLAEMIQTRIVYIKTK